MLTRTQISSVTNVDPNPGAETAALKRFAYPQAEGVTVFALCDVSAKVDVVLPAQFEANATASSRENCRSEIG